MRPLRVTVLFVLFVLTVGVGAGSGQTPAGAPAEPAPQEQAADGPTLQETVEWLRPKLALAGVSYTDVVVTKAIIPTRGQNTDTQEFRYDVEFKDIVVDNCTVSWKTVVKSTQSVISAGETRDDEPSVTNNTYEHNVRLADIDPLGIKFAQHEPDASGWTQLVKASTSPDVWNVVLRTHGMKGHDFILDIFMFNDKETAKRVAKALQHASKLCGGKVEPF